MKAVSNTARGLFLLTLLAMGLSATPTSSYTASLWCAVICLIAFALLLMRTTKNRVDYALAWIVLGMLGAVLLTPFAPVSDLLGAVVWAVLT